METYSGGCHCGAVVFEVDLANGVEQVRRCNCSLCRRKGAVMAGVPLNNLRIVQGRDKLTLYQRATLQYCLSVSETGRCQHGYHRNRSSP